VLVGLYEEFLFRGYAQYTLSKGIGFWPAAVVLSGVFGGLHLSNSGEDWVGAASVFVFGMFACFTLWRTGNLWFAVGFHAAGDYAESFIYSVPDSGTLATGHLLHSSFHGPAWLTGGTVGPEGSVLSFVVFVLAFILFALVYRSKTNENLPAPQTAVTTGKL
jgi:CAAX protease family protein